MLCGRTNLPSAICHLSYRVAARLTMLCRQANLLLAIGYCREAAFLPLSKLQLLPFCLGFDRIAGGKLAFEHRKTQRIEQ